MYSVRIVFDMPRICRLSFRTSCNPHGDAHSTSISSSPGTESDATPVTLQGCRIGQFGFEAREDILNFLHNEIIALQNRLELFVRRLALTPLAVSCAVEVGEKQEIVNGRKFTTLRQWAKRGIIREARR